MNSIIKPMRTVILSIILIFAMVLANVSVASAGTLSDGNEDTNHLVILSPGGPINFYISSFYNEDYTYVGDPNDTYRYDNRCAIVHVNSSRPAGEQPSCAITVSLKHYDGNGTALQTFSMTGSNHAIIVSLPYFKLYHKDNTTAKLYPSNVGIYGEMKYNLRGSTFLSPGSVSETRHIDFF